MMLLPKIEATEPLKSDDGNGSIDTILRQTIGKEPYLSFSRANDSSVQLNQILHAMNQPAYLSGWPLHLLSPMKVQLQKCEKCSQEFCSTISYRRHLRLHRRKLNVDKDLATKNRGLLQAFWDKLSVEETMEIMSIDDVPLEGISGSSIVKALTSLIRKPGYISLPQNYVKSGSVLLDLVQGRPLRFPISSQELFNVLDDASENTFLCAGTAESLQKHVFDGDAGKIGLEMRNLVACTSFLVEQKLVKACLADKDAEALRYQKLLMDEEDAAQKRQAALMEKKRRKKLRQKEQKTKELAIAEMDDSPEESFSSPPSSSPDDYDSTLDLLVLPPDAPPSPKNFYESNVEADIVNNQEKRHPDVIAHQKSYSDFEAHQNSDHKRLHRDGQRHVANSRWQTQKMYRNSNPNGFHSSHNFYAPKPGAIQKQTSSRNSHTAANITKVWTVKPKSESDDGSSKPKLAIEEPKLPCQETKLLIGSISVSLGNHHVRRQNGKIGRLSENSALELSVPGENGIRETSIKGDETQGQHADGNELPIENSITAPNASDAFCGDSDGVQPAVVVESISNDREDKIDARVEESGHQGTVKFSSRLAEAFLSQRWKEAVTADHVELILYPEASPEQSMAQNESKQESASSPELTETIILRSAKNPLPISVTIDSSAPVKSKARPKAKNGSKVKYIQKQRSVL